MVQSLFFSDVFVDVAVVGLQWKDSTHGSLWTKNDQGGFKQFYVTLTSYP